MFGKTSRSTQKFQLNLNLWMMEWECSFFWAALRDACLIFNSLIEVFSHKKRIYQSFFTQKLYNQKTKGYRLYLYCE
mgnify:CR=1 FL=1